MTFVKYVSINNYTMILCGSKILAVQITYAQNMRFYHTPVLRSFCALPA
jgi:hypothetical protein